jgi:carbamoylphosphate synthase small subunit
MKLGYCPIGNGDSIFPFNMIFDKKSSIQNKIDDDIDAVVFWGGSDIHPSLYKDRSSIRTGAGDLPSARDEFEWKAMKYCKVKGIPMIGICRGGQMLTALAGGKLIQHVTGHQNSPHDMTTRTGEVISTTSCHHQMMDPRGTDHDLLAWSSKRLSNTYVGGDDRQVDMEGEVEPEIIWYPGIKGLAIQGHPEWAIPGCNFINYCNKLIMEYMFPEMIKV